MAINSAAELARVIEIQQDQIRQMAKLLDEAVEQWSKEDAKLAPERMGATARDAGVPNATVAEYVNGMTSWMASARQSIGKSSEELDTAYRSLGALAHCVAALRGRATRARTAREVGGSVV